MSNLIGSASGTDFDILSYAASGMEAQRGALDVAARNIALAQTATPDHPVKALAPVFSADANAVSGNSFASLVHAASASDDDTDTDTDDDDDQDDNGAWSAAQGVNGTQGLVAMTGVRQTNIDLNPITEMIDALNAQRAYEANASVFDLGKTLISKALDLEKA